MIFYFTGTGNSLYAAKTVADVQRDQVRSIAREMDQHKDSVCYELGENELLGFVYPVYAWAPPKIVLDFIGSLHVAGNPYTFSICTCGDEEGQTTRVLRNALAARGITLDSAFTLRMPNNYIVGYDVDPKELELKKLEAANRKLAEINHIIGEREKHFSHTIPGKHPLLKTTLINPLFNRFARNTKKFYADENCTGCGLCEKICPVHTIKVSGKPAWGEPCTQCLACINRCPARAIQIGKGTAQKGRYQHPELSNLEKQV